MVIKCGFELSMILDSDEFEEIFDRCFCEVDYPEEEDSEFVDRSLLDKGIVVRYRNSQYKKKIRLLVDVAAITGNESSTADKLIRKLDKRISSYFDNELQLSDFHVSGMFLSTDIDLESADSVRNYIRVLQRVGKVKGFSPIELEYLDGVDCFCLEGNSNGTKFIAYDLAQAIAAQMKRNEINTLYLQTAAEKTEETLRFEVHLKKPKALQQYVVEYATEDQLAKLYAKRHTIFLDTFVKIVPYGDFYKKAEAVEILRKEVADDVLKRKMLKLIALIPEKKSLYLAQKAMAYRHPDRLLVELAKINISPVTIGKRQNIKRLKNIYDYIEF